MISSVGGFELAAVLLVCVNSGMSIDHCCVLSLLVLFLANKVVQVL